MDSSCRFVNIIFGYVYDAYEPIRGRVYLLSVFVCIANITRVIYDLNGYSFLGIKKKLERVVVYLRIRLVLGGPFGWVFYARKLTKNKTKTKMVNLRW